VSDLIDGMIRMMNSPDDVTGPINLGNPEERTILQLAEQIRGLTNSKSRIVFRDLPQDDPLRRRPDIGLATSQLGWAPKVGLDEGLGSTIDFFRRLVAGSSV
jgi:UDP-glucuronate decarboxylase